MTPLLRPQTPVRTSDDRIAFPNAAPRFSLSPAMFESPKSHRIPSTDAALTKGSDVALAVYAESALAIRGRRGLVIGPSDAGFGERLLELGARSVHLFDPLASRAEAAARLESGRGLTVRTLDDRALDFRDGAFDFALVTELADVPSRATALAQIRRILERGGALLVRTRASGGIEYGELFDLLSLEFSCVSMIGEVPFGGVAFAELGAEAPEVSVDSQLADAPPPLAYLALASQEPRPLEAYAIVQLPGALAEADVNAAAVRELEDAEAVARLTGEVYALREQLDNEGEKGMRLAMELETALHALGEARKVAEQRHAEAMQASQEASVALQVRLAVELEEKLQASQLDLAMRLEETEAQLLVQDAQVIRLSQDLIAAKKKLDVPHVDAKVAEDLAERLATAERAAVAERAALTERLAVSERKRVAIETELGHLAAEHVTELSSLEAQLRDRGRMLKAQDLELARRATMVEDLLSALEDAQAGATIALAERPVQDDARLVELRATLDAMALDSARREAELEARGWRIKELELEKQLAVAAANEAAQAYEEAREAAKQARAAAKEAEAHAAAKEAEAHAAAKEAEARAAAKRNDATAESPTHAGDAHGSEKDRAKIERLEEELFALRQALVQEHAARVAAEGPRPSEELQNKNER